MPAVTGPNHALLVGHVIGGLLGVDWYEVRPIFDGEGNYTAEFVVDADSGRYVVTVDYDGEGS